MSIKKTIAIASAKGGVGKSSITSLLAKKLSRDFSIGILDADIYGPNQHIIFDVTSAKPEIIEEDHKKRFIPLNVEGIRLNSMGFILDNEKAAIWRGPMLSGAIKQLSELTKWGDLDYLLIDMPPGTGDAYLTVASEIKPDGVILVTSNSKLAVSDTLKSVQVFRKLNLPCMGFILNMADNSQGKFILPADEVEKMLGTKFFGSIPLNDEIKNFNFDRKNIQLKFSNEHNLFIDALNDDLNTPGAIGVFFSFISEMNKKIAENSINDTDKEKSLVFLKLFNSIFDILDFDNLHDQNIPKELQDLLVSRQVARENLDWKLSDSIRDKIESLGWHVEDTSSGQNLSKKK